MNEAIEFSLGGNNKGFVAVLNDSEQKAKQAGERIGKTLDKATDRKFSGSKLREGLNDIAGDFAKVTSVSQAFDTALSRLGAGLKIGGAALAVSEVAGRISDATEKVRELKEELAQLSRPSGGQNNVGLVSGDLVVQRIKDLEAFQGKNTPKGYGDVVTSFWGGLGTSASDAIMGRRNFSFDDAINGQASRANGVEGLIKAEKDKLVKKYLKGLEVFFMRTSGNVEGAELAEMKNRYSERIGAVGNNEKLRKQIESARDADIAALEARHGNADSARTSSERMANLQAGSANSALGQSSIDEQRRANELRLEQALVEHKNLSEQNLAKPNDKEIASALYVAEKNVEQVKAQNAKWERDIARSKGDQIALAEAEAKATELRMSGREKEAQLIERRARSEQEALRTSRELGKEMGDQVRKLNQMKEGADRFADALRPDGRLRSESERIGDVRSSRINRRNTSRSRSRYDRNQGLLSVKRGTNGEIISGIDPVSGQRVGPDGAAIQADPLYVRGGAIDAPVGLSGGIDAFKDWNSSGHKTEVSVAEWTGQKARATAMAMEKANAANETIAATTGGSKDGDALKGILKILREWSK